MKKIILLLIVGGIAWAGHTKFQRDSLAKANVQQQMTVGIEPLQELKPKIAPIDIKPLPELKSKKYDDEVNAFPEPSQGTMERQSSREAERHQLTPGHIRQWNENIQPHFSGARKGQLYSSVLPTVSPAIAIRKELQDIYKIEDPVVRNSAYYKLVGYRDGLIAKAQLSAIQQAEAEFHLPELQQMYTQSLASDRADPLWSKYQVPSTITSQLQDQIIKATAAAKGQASKYYLANSEIQKITNSLDLEFKNFERISAVMESDAQHQRETGQASSLFGNESRQLVK